MKAYNYSRYLENWKNPYEKEQDAYYKEASRLYDLQRTTGDKKYGEQAYKLFNDVGRSINEKSDIEYNKYNKQLYHGTGNAFSENNFPKVGQVISNIPKMPKEEGTNWSNFYEHPNGYKGMQPEGYKFDYVNSDSWMNFIPQYKKPVQPYRVDNNLPISQPNQLPTEQQYIPQPINNPYVIETEQWQSPNVENGQLIQHAGIYKNRKVDIPRTTQYKKGGKVDT